MPNLVLSLQLDGIPCSSTCANHFLKGDNYCHDENNNCGCEWDGGDCCGDNVNTQWCSACECLEHACECLEHGNDVLSIYNGGSNSSEMVAELTGTMNDIKISIPGNQMFLVFRTNEEIVRKGFHALIIESKYIKRYSF